MANDRPARARFGQHRRRQAASMRAAIVHVTVLRADKGAALHLIGRRDQRRGQAQPHLGHRTLSRQRADRFDFGQL